MATANGNENSLFPYKAAYLRFFHTSWYGTINNSNRLLLYSRYKHDFEQEKYPDFIQENKFRTALTKFRLSSHDLAIERGRYESIPRDERICK